MTAVAAASSQPAGPPPAADRDTGALQPFHAGGVLALAAAFLVLELALAARYGYHRDELYFLACARHMAWGYVDQPPLVPAVAWFETHVFGSSPVALRIIPAIVGAACVLLTALTARELGGGRRAQTLAALAAASSVQVVATTHLLSTATFDLLAWAAITYVVVRLLRTGDERLWVVVGVLTGVGLLNKYNVIVLMVGLAVGLVAAGRGRELANRWLCAGALIALVIWSPNLVWNAQHHWAALAMLHALRQENSTLSASISFIPAQLLIVGPVLIPVWFGGLRRLLHDSLGRPLALAYITLVVLDVLTGAKAYYLGGIYFVLFAAGGMWADERIGRSARGHPAHPARRLVTWIVVGEALVIAFALPVRPVSDLASGAWESKIDKDLSATVGWDRVVRQVAGIADQLPPAERAHLVVFTGDYGAAGAVDRFGSRYGLPHAISGHNTYWWWGPAGAQDGATTIAVDLDRSYLETIFGQVVPAGTVDTGHGVWTEELGDPIWICRQQKVSWAAAWPAARHYG